MLESLDLKAALDIGLGAVSILLWLRQGKVNRAQVELDEKQNQNTEDLTKLVKDHDSRIRKLEDGHEELHEAISASKLPVLVRAPRKRRH